MEFKIIKPDYERSILSISSSLLKNYNIKSNYNSLEELDIILKDNYKNVVFLILDCLGKNILENNMSKDSFLRKNFLTNVTSVFPPTTVAATTSFHSGISPYENGWVGWMPYFKEYNKMIELFTGKDFYTGEKIMESPEKGCLKYQTIYEQVCEKNSGVKYHKVFPNFNDGGANSFEELCNNIKTACQNENRNLISAYWTEPDHTIHYHGIKSVEVQEILKEIDINLKNLAEELKDTLIIVSADHGAVDVKECFLNELPEIDECLKLPPSIESRFVSFFVKEGKHEEFKLAFNKHFKDKGLLFTKEEFMKEKLLGFGQKHNRIDEYIGDFVFISTSEINIRYSVTNGKEKLHVADHGGLTEDELVVPVIVIKCNKN